MAACYCGVIAKAVKIILDQLTLPVCEVAFAVTFRTVRSGFGIADYQYMFMETVFPLSERHHINL